MRKFKIFNGGSTNTLMKSLKSGIPRGHKCLDYVHFLKVLSESSNKCIMHHYDSIGHYVDFGTCYIRDQ